MNALIDAHTALKRILQHLPEVVAIDCPLTKCAGRILREPVRADRPFPPFDRAMLDGFALRAAETGSPDPYTITAQAPAGSPQTEIGQELRACAEIMTGAVLPKDADCVVPYEATERLDDHHMRIPEKASYRPGDAVHPQGSDHDAGTPLLEPGIILGSREIAVAATCGYDQLKVSKIPSIAIAATGDELVEVAARPKPHQIRRSNDLAIETALARVQLHAQQRVHLLDDAETCQAQLRALTEANTFVILSGGISMGKKDFIPEALDQLGLKCHFHGVAQKPGKPMGFWSGPSCAVFALPGNPLSTLSCLHHYVIPAIQSAQQRQQPIPKQWVRLSEAPRVRGDLTVFMPVQLEDGNTARPRPPRNSGDLVSILQSDGYIEIPPGSAEAASNTEYALHLWW